jgi:hypothetical protein
VPRPQGRPISEANPDNKRPPKDARAVTVQAPTLPITDGTICSRGVQTGTPANLERVAAGWFHRSTFSVILSSGATLRCSWVPWDGGGNLAGHLIVERRTLAYQLTVQQREEGSLIGWARSYGESLDVEKTSLPDAPAPKPPATLEDLVCEGWSADEARVLIQALSNLRDPRPPFPAVFAGASTAEALQKSVLLVPHPPRGAFDERPMCDLVRLARLIVAHPEFSVRQPAAPATAPLQESRPSLLERDAALAAQGVPMCPTCSERDRVTMLPDSWWCDRCFGHLDWLQGEPRRRPTADF